MSLTPLLSPWPQWHNILDSPLGLHSVTSGPPLAASPMTAMSPRGGDRRNLQYVIITHEWYLQYVLHAVITHEWYDVCASWPLMVMSTRYCTPGWRDSAHCYGLQRTCELESDSTRNGEKLKMSAYSTITWRKAAGCLKFTRCHYIGCSDTNHKTN
jgi:hypothetical protein